jgi:hypothetical protein
MSRDSYRIAKNGDLDVELGMEMQALLDMYAENERLRAEVEQAKADAERWAHEAGRIQANIGHLLQRIDAVEDVDVYTPSGVREILDDPDGHDGQWLRRVDVMYALKGNDE